MKIEVRNNNIEIKIEFTSKEEFVKYLEIVKNLPRRTYDAQRKVWIIPIKDLEYVRHIFPSAPIINEPIIQLKQSSYGEITLYPFQVEGVKFLMKSKQCLLADDMGLGKTIEAISAIKELELDNIIIVCPNVAKYNWERELRRMGEDDILIFNAKSLHPVKWLILNYEKLKNLYLNEPPECVILDEAHAFKSAKAQRTMYVFKLFNKCEYKFLLTGTPVLNNIVEIFNLLRFIDAERFKSFYEFAYRYTEPIITRYGTEFKGFRRSGELKLRLNSILLRREKKEVLKDLPDITRSYMEIDITNRSDYDWAEDEFIKYLIGRYADIGKVDRALRAEAIVRMNELRKLALEGKMEQICDLVGLILDGKKIVVYSTLKLFLEPLQKRFGGKEVVLTGDVKDKQGAVDEFVKGDRQLLLATVDTGGQAINLQVADYVVFCDLDWTPATHSQAEARVHRMGHVGGVIAYYCIGKDTIDNYLIEILQKKINIIQSIVDNDSSVGLVDTVISKYLERKPKSKREEDYAEVIKKANE